MLQLVGGFVIYILCYNVRCGIESHLFLHVNAKAAKQVKQYLSLHSLKGCNGHSITCNRFRHLRTTAMKQCNCAVAKVHYEQANLMLPAPLSLETACAAAKRQAVNTLPKSQLSHVQTFP